MGTHSVVPFRMWKEVRSLVIREHFNGQRPVGCAGNFHLLRRMKAVFINYGGIVWLWKLAALEVLEVFSQSLVVRTV